MAPTAAVSVRKERDPAKSEGAAPPLWRDKTASMQIVIKLHYLPGATSPRRLR